LNKIVSPFEMTRNNSGTFYIDDVRWMTSDVSPNFFKVTISTRTPLASTTTLTWSSISLPSRGVLADQYLQVLTNASNSTWGAQIYTDNTGSGASPAYAGAGNASGLVDVTSPTKTVPLLWTILDTVDVSTAPGNPIFNPGTAEFNAPFFYIKDLAGSAPLTNMEDYITTMNNTGIHYSPGSTNYGATRTPDYIFIAADFTNAVTPRTYKTNRLTLEFFTP
jgi:hypothetical protein